MIDRRQLVQSLMAGGGGGGGRLTPFSPIVNMLNQAMGFQRYNEQEEKSDAAAALKTRFMTMQMMKLQAEAEKLGRPAAPLSPAGKREFDLGQGNLTQSGFDAATAHANRIPLPPTTQLEKFMALNNIDPTSPQGQALFAQAIKKTVTPTSLFPETVANKEAALGDKSEAALLAKFRDTRKQVYLRISKERQYRGLPQEEVLAVADQITGQLMGYTEQSLLGGPSAPGGPPLNPNYVAPGSANQNVNPLSKYLNY